MPYTGQHTGRIMTEDSRRANPSFVTVWVVPIVCVVALSAIVAYLARRYGDWSFSFAFCATLIVILGTAAWILGVYSLYEVAAKHLGWECATGPQLTPDGRSVVADIVIRGEVGGRPFTLSRSKSTSTGRRTVVSSSVEWTGKDIRVPSFSLHLEKSIDAGLARITGSEDIAEAILGALSRKSPWPRVSLDESTRLARRAKLGAPDPASALAYFNPMRCDALDALVSAGSVEGEPGRIAVHASGFPMPWQLRAFLERADAVRNVLMT
jgi:hypothetical protein